MRGDQGNRGPSGIASRTGARRPPSPGSLDTLESGPSWAGVAAVWGLAGSGRSTPQHGKAARGSRESDRQPPPPARQRRRPRTQPQPALAAFSFQDSAELCAHCGEQIARFTEMTCDHCLYDYCPSHGARDSHECSEVCAEGPEGLEGNDVLDS